MVHRFKITQIPDGLSSSSSAGSTENNSNSVNNCANTNGSGASSNNNNNNNNKRRCRSRKYMDDDEKRKNFLERNRQAALKCRQRKKQWLNDLQAKADFLTADNEQLQMHICALRDEVMHLRSLLYAHKDCPVSLAQKQQQQHQRSMGPVSVIPPQTPQANDYESFSSMLQSSTALDISAQQDFGKLTTAAHSAVMLPGHPSGAMRPW
ncbi:hypothetical protein VTP01DRAFT_1034 [Rhizomucor pusillus]|uniref:uncharacterized protein n=1 Tax=Rhizomucor pusillus TaxID=4840 RepID=UPI003743AF77